MTSFVMIMNSKVNLQQGAEGHFSEELAWIALAREDMNAFKPLYEKYYEPVYIFIYRRCANTDDCLDLTSRVFEKAMLNIHKYQFRGFAFGTWLYRIAHNELADHFRKKSREQKLWVHDEGLAEMVTDLQYSSDKEERLQAVIEALKMLDDNERNLVVMRYFEKRDYEELAEIEKSTVNYLRVKMHRILSKIKTMMERRNLL